MKPIESPEQLKQWLEGKPIIWAQVIAARLALRTLFLAMTRANVHYAQDLPLAVFRASLISWTAGNYPAISWAASDYPSNAMGFSAMYASSQSHIAADNAAAGPEGAALTTATTTAHVAALAARAVGQPIDADEYVVIAAQESAAVADNAILWSNLNSDCDWLASRANPKDAVRALTRKRLWWRSLPKAEMRHWQAHKEMLLAISPSYEVCIEWYERRIKGERSAFEIPGDTGRKEDKWLLRQIVYATDEGFWGRGAEHVNRQLADWLEEARERAQREQKRQADLRKKIFGELFPENTVVPPQNEQVLRFAQDPEGRIALSPDTNLSELRIDEDARDRHLLAVEDAKQLLAACAGLNSAERLTAILTSYISAAGETLEEMRPSLYVQKGERLRQELGRYENDDTDLPPLPDRVLLDLKSVCKAHNMVVGLDPALIARDTAQLPPDAVVGDVTPAEVRDFVHGADEAGILQSDVPDIMDEAVALVPPGADATDRRFRWCVESCRNLVIEAFAVSLNRPAKAATTVAAVAMLGPGLLVGNALNTAKFLVESRVWIEERLGRHAPTWKALFVDLCDKLEKNTPLGAAAKKV